jgi:hypothetical protein
MDVKNVNSNGGNDAERNSKSISFLKIVKIEPIKQGSKFFSERDAFNAHKTSLVISFTSLIGME